ncbi:hypothetical protein ED733_003480 [Metarhizium rileyi]|uniref:Uncharacterized protein n=1 Tax=Metarhizium rileyi (strain RCEF 4871) TaxID=1649241 RepID=A0A5C6G9P7_METRR|nr:hypothetical protein ED733_003480 [Metarhizium rileyi]
MAEPTPRRHRSERPRRRSPDAVPSYGQDAYPPRRAYSRREAPEPRGMTQPGSSGRRARSPPPYNYSESTPREERKGSRRESRPSAQERHAPRRYDDRSSYPAPGDYAGSRDAPRRSHRDELERRPRRDRASSPSDYRPHGRKDGSHKTRPVSPEPKPRPRDAPPPPPPRDYTSSPFAPRRSHRDEPKHRSRRDRASSPPDYRSRGRENGPPKNRATSPESKPRPRDAPPPPPPGYGNDDKRHHRARSQDRSRRRDVSPGRGHDRAVAAATRPSTSSRRKSAPVPTADKAKEQAWWQNPLLQAGARTAFAAGAQAAMQNRNNPDPWLGAKGVRVATAALGAALMDGLGGKKKKN